MAHVYGSEIEGPDYYIDPDEEPEGGMEVGIDVCSHGVSSCDECEECQECQECHEDDIT